MTKTDPAEKMVRDIRRKTRKRHSSEEKIQTVLPGPSSAKFEGKDHFE